jgi:hypothetical protein
MKNLTLVLLLGATTLRAADTPEVVLSEGRTLVQQGNFESAVLKLDEATRVLAGDATRTRALADAYLLLGIAYVGLNQELNARAKFMEVLKKEPQLHLSELTYSKQVIRVFEAARQELYPKKKKRFLPLLLIAGGGTAATGTAIAASSSGGDAPTTTLPGSTTSTTTGAGGATRTPTPTTVVTDPGNPTSTPTPTTLPGTTPTPTPVGPTATPTVTPTGPTATPTATAVGPTATPTGAPPTATPTRTPTPSCSYTLSPPTMQFALLGGNGTCTVTTQVGCPWEASKDASFFSFTGATTGSGSGAIPYTVQALTLGTRTGRITLAQAPGAECVIVQGLLIADKAPSSVWESTLDVEGARGQLVIDGQSLRYVDRGVARGELAAGSGVRQVVAQLVAARGRAGTWSFRLPTARPGSVRALAGDAVEVTPDRVTFRLDGRPGERVVFSFETAP